MDNGSGRRRLSSMFGSKKDRSQRDQLGSPDHNDVSRHRPSNADTTDSAYASSSATGPSQSHLDLTPIENHGQIQGVNSNRDLAVNRANGDVVDQGSGQVVTTTTTTTTTTVTGPNGQREQQVDVQTQPAPSQPDTSPSNEPTVTEMPAEPVQRHDQPNNSTSSSAMGVPPGASERISREQDGPVTPPVSSTQPDRMGSPSSPNAPNFSRPGRSGEGAGALSSLKAAAKGLHGVGETLRGTLNGELDSRIPGSSPEAAAAANAKNQAVMETGRRHMEGVMRDPVVSPVSSTPQHAAGSAEQPAAALGASSQPMNAAPTSTVNQLDNQAPATTSTPSVTSPPISSTPSAQPPTRSTSRSPFQAFRKQKTDYIPPQGTAIPETTQPETSQPAVAGSTGERRGSNRLSKFLSKRSSRAM